MVKRFNEFVNESGFYYGHDETPEEGFGEEMPMDMEKPEMRLGDHDTQGLFHEIDQAVMRLMKSSGMSMSDIMDHIADVAAGYRSKR
jgi:hypothetical protein